MLNRKSGSMNLSGISPLVTSGILAMTLSVSGCGKSVTVKDRGSVSPSKTAPGPQASPQPSPAPTPKPSPTPEASPSPKPSPKPSPSPQASPAAPASATKPAAPVEPPRTGVGSLEMPSKPVSTVGAFNVGPLILTNKPKLGDSVAADCDKQRVAAQEKFLRSSGLAAELAKIIDPVILKLTEAQWDSLKMNLGVASKDAKNQINATLREGFGSAGYRTSAPDFAAVTTEPNDSAQTYLGIWREGPVLASVKRLRTLGKHLLVTKLNWAPVKETYLVSVQVFEVQAGKKLTIQGVPSQDLYVGKPVGGSLLVYLDLTQVSRDCKGLTAMSVEEQFKFSTLPVARFTK
jgi:hypothetical protein